MGLPGSPGSRTTIPPRSVKTLSWPRDSEAYEHPTRSAREAMTRRMATGDDPRGDSETMAVMIGSGEMEDPGRWSLVSPRPEGSRRPDRTASSPAELALPDSNR